MTDPEPSASISNCSHALPGRRISAASRSKWSRSISSTRQKSTVSPARKTELENRSTLPFTLQRPASIARLMNLTEGTWLNTDAKSLADLRGQYILLDFWFIGCGPCHADLPIVKLAHEHFSKHGFSVVSVHTKDQSPTEVKKFAVGLRIEAVKNLVAVGESHGPGNRRP